MPTDDSAHTPAAEQLKRAQALNEAGLPAQARDAAWPAWAGSADLGIRLEAGTIAAIASFRLGELNRAVAIGDAVMSHLRSGMPNLHRFDILAMLVVANGELARYDESIEALRLLLSQASRSTSMRELVRARGSAALCFSLMGDPWAAQRLMDEVVALLAAMPDDRRLEATARSNHVGVCLMVARQALATADSATADATLEVVRHSLARSAELATELGDPRVAAFARVHEGEAELLRGDPAAALEIIRAALSQVKGAGLTAHLRRLRILEAEALVETGIFRLALDLLNRLNAELTAGQELSSRIMVPHLLARAHWGLGDTPSAIEAFDRFRWLEHYRSARQLQAMSKHGRTRLEFEHLYRIDVQRAVARQTSPGALGD